MVNTVSNGFSCSAAKSSKLSVFPVSLAGTFLLFLFYYSVVEPEMEMYVLIGYCALVIVVATWVMLYLMPVCIYVVAN